MVPGIRYLGMVALVTNLGVYMAGIALGAVITALMVVFLRLMMFRKGKLLIDSL